MNKPFNLEAFKAGQKALTRDGRVATFVGIRTDGRAVYEHPDGCLLSVTGKGFWWKNELPSINDLVSMVSRHQHLIDSYDLEDTWQFEYRCDKGSWFTLSEVPKWKEHNNYRLHPHNDLIKAHKKGAKIEMALTPDEPFYDDNNPTWDEQCVYRIKPEPKTKTVYEWIYKDGDGEWRMSATLNTNSELTEYKGLKTGRSFEVEV